MGRAPRLERFLRPRALLLGVIVLPMANTCAQGGPQPLAEETEMTGRSIEEVQEAHMQEWMRLPGVVGGGIGLCDGEPCIRIFLSEPSPVAEREIPAEVEGYPVELEVTGAVRPR